MKRFFQQASHNDKAVNPSSDIISLTSLRVMKSESTSGVLFSSGPLSGKDRLDFYTFCTLEKMLGFAIWLVDRNITTCNADMSTAAVNANTVK